MSCDSSISLGTAFAAALGGIAMYDVGFVWDWMCGIQDQWLGDVVMARDRDGEYVSCGLAWMVMEKAPTKHESENCD